MGFMVSAPVLIAVDERAPSPGQVGQMWSVMMDVDGCTGRERDPRRAPQAAGRWPIGRVLTVAAIVGSAFVTVVTWPGW
jgi:hypothetical protein